MTAPALFSALRSGLCALVLAGCGGGSLTMRDPSVAQASSTPVRWSVVDADIGHVEAVADAGEELAVFTDAGAFVFSSGALVGGDRSARRWLGAAVVPGTSGSPWAVGFDDRGSVLRLRDRTRLDDVTGRFALSGHKVTSAFVLDGRAVFVTDAGIVLVERERVRFLSIHASGGAAGGGVVALYDDGGVTRLTNDLAAAVRYPLAGVFAVAVDDRGGVYAATRDGVYRELGGRLELVYRSSVGSVGGLASSGSRVWVAEAGTLFLLEHDADGTSSIPRTTRIAAPSFGRDARLFGSPSGAVWIVDGGRLRGLALAADASRPTDEAAWRQAVQPVFQRACARCHMADGPAGVDLSTPAAWHASRDEIRKRVVVERTMPPREAPPLADAERRALESWLGR